MKHTPAPWYANTRGSQGLIYNEDGANVAVSYNVEDARLIAAAPELLEALQELFEQCAMVHKHWGDGSNQKESDSAIAAGLAAIAKATS